MIDSRGIWEVKIQKTQKIQENRKYANFLGFQQCLQPGPYSSWLSVSVAYNLGDKNITGRN